MSATINETNDHPAATVMRRAVERSHQVIDSEKPRRTRTTKSRGRTGRPKGGRVKGAAPGKSAGGNPRDAVVVLSRREQLTRWIAEHGDQNATLDLALNEFPDVGESTLRQDIGRILSSMREALQATVPDLAAIARAAVVRDIQEARNDRAWPAVAALHRVRMQLEGTAAPEKHQVTVEHGTVEGRALVERFLASRGTVAASAQKQVELEAVVVEGEAVAYVGTQKPTAAQEPMEATADGSCALEAAETVHGAPARPGDEPRAEPCRPSDAAVMPWDVEAWEDG